MSNSKVESTVPHPRKINGVILSTLLITALTLIAFFLRVWRLDDIPPGWRDDELINSLVISQKVLDGDLAVYYPDASGHEALYHMMSAVTLAIFGSGVAGIRLLPAILGTLTVPLTYVVASRLFGKKIGFIAAACLTVSFWSLMYSRIGIRHISTPLFMLPAFYFFLRGLKINFSISQAGAPSPAEGPNPSTSTSRKSLKWLLLAGLFVGIGFYTYFASRGIPVIILTFLIYLALFQLWRLKRHWPGLLLMAGVTLLLALPLIIVLTGQPETEARVGELAVPITDALEGDFSSLTEHISRTLRMFLNDGDDEWLYNIPNRPVFSVIGAVFFWSGLAVAIWFAVKPVFRLLLRLFKKEPGVFSATLHMEAACAFLIIWWIGGIAPGFISVPAASLGHTIIAQSAAYILLALPFIPLRHVGRRHAGSRLFSWRIGSFNGGSALSLAAGLILLFSLILRDLPDYYRNWPERGMVRFLYRADIKELAQYIEENPGLDGFSVSGLLAGPWDRLALEIELQDGVQVQPRWYNPERASFLLISDQPATTFTGYPLDASPFDSLYQAVEDGPVGAYQLSQVLGDISFIGEPVCFVNGLCLIDAKYDLQSGSLDLTWEGQRSLSIPESPLLSNPPPPGIYSGPRLLVFAQLLDQDGLLIVGDDGLWVDAATLRPGDRFIQRHRLEDPGNGSTIIFGLYDPMNGKRILTSEGQDHLQIVIVRGS
jgi:4-amino-4-deoxy-L-arabinose transferase-like glycosyltransferase